jgi:hypothetical protein
LRDWPEQWSSALGAFNTGNAMPVQEQLRSGAFEFQGPAYRILGKQNHLMIDVRIEKKLDSFAISFAFQGF